MTEMTDTTATGQQVIYCHCAYSAVIPDSVKNTALRDILQKGLDFQAVPDLCKMAAEGDERLHTIAASEDVTVVACYPRAVKSLFDRVGAPLDLAGGKARVINMRDVDADAVVEALPEPAVAVPDKSEAELEAEFSELTTTLMADASEEDAWKPWFPVVDYDRCTHCGLCSNFCIFGVYKIEEGKLRVDNPENCKTDCPACARVCPETAIVFPKHTDDSPISGSDAAADGDNAAVDMGAKLQGDVMGLLRGRSRRSRMRFAKHAPDAAKLCACAAETGMLADLGIPAEVLANSADAIQEAITANPELVQLAAKAIQNAPAKTPAKKSPGGAIGEET